MASPQATKLKDAFRLFRDQSLGKPQATLEEMRVNAVAFGNLTSEPVGVTCSQVDADGVRAQWLIPQGATTERVLMYVHGGGYVMMSAETHRKMVSHIAKAAGCRALNVDYRLAPEHPHPAPVNDAVTAYRWLLAQGIKPSAIAIAGDSAGGGLCLATALKLRDLGVALPAALVPISPWTDMEGTGESMKTRAEFDMIVSPAAIAQIAGAFLQGTSARDPYASPLHAELKGLPPIYIQVGDEEVLLDDSVRFADKAKKAGVEITLEIFPEMQHVFQIAAGTLPEADLAIAKIGAWLKTRLT
ncbi:MAG: alpha/beta hydrolase [Gammaproteobacteria bacterium]|nr:alpha/beta hydrolase [Gammaproteobacteria bacterium]